VIDSMTHLKHLSVATFWNKTNKNTEKTVVSSSLWIATLLKSFKKYMFYTKCLRKQ